jgi:hypothetical protein
MVFSLRICSTIKWEVLYVRRFSLKASLSDAEVAAYWKFLVEAAMPAIQKVQGVRSVKLYSGAGGLRTDLRAVIDMDDAGVYRRMLLDPQVRPLIAKLYSTWDMTAASQTFLREVTPELLRALTGSA